MANKTTDNSKKEKLLSKLNATWAAIIAGITIFGFGYAGGTVISNIFHKIEINEINQSKNIQLFNQKKDFDSKVQELIHEKRLLEIENEKLRKK